MHLLALVHLFALVHLSAYAHLIGAAFLLATSDNFGITSWLNQFIALLTGPMAMFIAIICIIAGAAMFISGREGHEGLKNLGMVGVAVGILAAMPKIWVAFGGSVSGITR